MPAALQNLVVEQGTTFRYEGTWSGISAIKNYTYQPYDVGTGYFFMQIRRAPGAPSLLTLYSQQPSHSPSSAILLLPDRGSFEIYITATDTAKFTFKKSRYDLFFVHEDGERSKVMFGNINVIPAVTNIEESAEIMKKDLTAQ